MDAPNNNLTLEEIGSRAGVSRSTVSRVLNGHPDVRPEVRERVESVIRETGYQPNPAARALVSKRSGLIGLVMLTDVDELFGDPYYSALVNGIRLGCAEHGLLFAIFPTESPDGGAEVLTPQIAQHFVDGVIVTAAARSDALITALRARGTRLVVVGHPADESAMHRVDVENRRGGAAAVDHLLARGRRRIAFVGPTAEHRFGDDRRLGYGDALAAAGIDVDERLVAVDQPTVDGARRATDRVLDASPDAIFAASDTIAEGAYQAIAARELRIPDDVAVVGFDGLPGRPALDPVLTTVVQPVIEIGRNAVALLAGEASEPRRVELSTELRLGASS